MDCPDCGKFVRCVDSRKKLSYVADIKKDTTNPPVRERKYICGRCQLIIITREKVFEKYKAHEIKDKRIKVRKSRKKK